MAPGGTLFRFAPHFGENVLPHGSHEWLPYSKDEVRLKTVNNNLSFAEFWEVIGKPGCRWGSPVDYVRGSFPIFPMTPQQRGSPSSQMALQRAEGLPGRVKAGRTMTG